VARTNTELLRKLIQKDTDREKQLIVLDRIERAGLTMSGLTEALLWLNRQENKVLPEQSVSLGELVKQTVDEQEYLLRGKAVNIHLTTDDAEHQLPEILCRIIIANLVRNALQHTNEGHVDIHQSGVQLEVTNRDSSMTSGTDELGFGLGLDLTRRLVEKYKWQISSEEFENGRRVCVSFTDSLDNV